MNVALLIALEGYADDDLPSIPFAQQDAQALSKALQLHGFDERDQVLLLDTSATKTIVESKIRRTLKSLTEEDQLIVYYVGHVFEEAGKTYLTCHDTQPSELAETSIALESLLKQLSKSDCQRFFLFYDPHQGVLSSDHTAAEELPSFFATCKNGVAFTSCATEQTSWGSGQLAHGIWAHHVIEAIGGNAPTALLKKTRLTAVSLQSYLQESVTQGLRLAFADDREQTPLEYGKSLTKDVLLLDMAPLFAQRKASASPLLDQAPRLMLYSDDVLEVRHIPGYKKSYQVPTDANSYFQSFMVSIASESIDNEISSMFNLLKSAFKFKRADISVALPMDGTGTIVTPYFNYSLTVTLDPKNPSDSIWHRQISEIKDLKKVLSDPFQQVFQSVFDAVEVISSTPVNVEALIDKIEAIGSDEVQVEYDSDATWCKIKIKGMPEQFEVNSQKLSVRHNSPLAPKLLLESFFKIQKSLSDTCHVTLLALDE